MITANTNTTNLKNIFLFHYFLYKCFNTTTATTKNNNNNLWCIIV